MKRRHFIASGLGRLAAAATLLTSAKGLAQPYLGNGVRYFATVFGYQDALRVPQKTHTWAVFERYPCAPHFEGGGGDGLFTISWLPYHFPQSLRLNIVAGPGRIYSHEETLAFAAQLGTSVRPFGPIEISEALYARAAARAEVLQSGRIGYQLLDPTQRQAAFLEQGGAVHCIHALTDIVGFVKTGTARGFESAELVAKLFATASQTTPVM